MNDRDHMGEEKPDAIFPTAPGRAEMSEEYFSFIEEIKDKIRSERISLVLHANAEMICLYWHIGKAILEKQEMEGWGSRVIDRISADIKKSFPDMSGFSPRNIKYMRKFALCWPEFEFVQQVIAQIPWGTNISLMDKLKDKECRVWYAYQTIEHGWSRSVLETQIQSRLIERSGRTVNNFQIALPPAESDLVNQTFKDPYLFDFLGTDVPRREKEMEQKLTEHIQSFLLELGKGFACEREEQDDCRIFFAGISKPDRCGRLEGADYTVFARGT